MAPRSSRKAALSTLIRVLREGSRSGPSLTQHLLAVPRWARAVLTGEYPGSSAGSLATLAAGVVYLLSPIDLVPELVLPLVGWVDDAMVLTWIAGRLLGETGDFLLWEQRRSSGAGRDVVNGEVVPQ
jgi:uncharacterized membrane protein YkvA (DUF1232 family)